MVQLPLVNVKCTESYVSQVLHNNNNNTTSSSSNQSTNASNNLRWVLRKRRPNRSSPAHIASTTLQTDHLFSRGLAVETVTESLVRYPLRFWLIENNCRSTQGFELQDSLEDQMILAKTMDVSTILCLLNNRTKDSPSRAAADETDEGEEQEEQEEQEAQGEFAILAQDVRAALQRGVIKKKDKEDGSVEKKDKKDDADNDDSDEDDKDDNSAGTGTSALTEEEEEEEDPGEDIPNSPEVVQQQVAEIIQRSRGQSTDAPDWEDLINDVMERVNAMEEQLLREQQQAIVVLATDSIDLDRRFAKKLKKLSRLPVKLLIRLYGTNELSLTGLQHLCKKARLPIQVLGDFDIHHARVSTLNPWFNYALPVHRCRELGVEPRAFRILDRRLLTEFELREFLVVLFGRKIMIQAPDIHAEWTRFYQFIRKVNDVSGQHFSSRTGQGEKWLDMQELSRLYGRPDLKSVGVEFAAKTTNHHGMQTTLEL